MKKLIALVFLIVLFLAFHLYTEQKFEQDLPMGMMERLEMWAGKLGKTQLTDDEELHGTRTLTDEDDSYAGKYVADCAETTGRDVVFGGASTNARGMVLTGNVTVDAGEATIRIRMNDEVTELEPKEDGSFEMDLPFESGGNYIMVDYDDFSGTVELICNDIAYEEDSQ